MATTKTRGSRETARSETYSYERKLLEEFGSLLAAWNKNLRGNGMGGVYEGAEAKQIRPKINRLVPAVDEVFELLGINPVVAWTPPPIMGGPIRQIDLLENVFHLHQYKMGIEMLLDLIQRADGLLEHLVKSGRLPVSQREGKATSIELLSALQRAIRQAFSAEPTDERKDLHPVVRVVLTSLGIPFTAEQERVAYSTTSAIPDFVLWEGQCAFEVKLIKRSEDQTRVIGEINDDIQKYMSRFSRKIFLVYDCGTLRDVESFRTDFMKNEGVFVLVVKH